MQPHANRLHPLARVQAAGQSFNAAALVGTTNDNVLRVGDVAGAIETPGIALSDDAADGSALTITARGLYLATFSLRQIASQALTFGISLNAAVLSGVPDLSVSGMLAVGQFSTIAANVKDVCLSALLPVTGTLAAAGAVLRFHARTTADGSPTGLVTVTDEAAIWNVLRVADLPE